MPKWFLLSLGPFYQTLLSEKLDNFPHLLSTGLWTPDACIAAASATTTRRNGKTFFSRQIESSTRMRKWLCSLKPKFDTHHTLEARTMKFGMRLKSKLDSRSGRREKICHAFLSERWHGSGENRNMTPNQIGREWKGGKKKRDRSAETAALSLTCEHAIHSMLSSFILCRSMAQSQFLQD